MNADKPLAVLQSEDYGKSVGLVILGILCVVSVIKIGIFITISVGMLSFVAFMYETFKRRTRLEFYENYVVVRRMFRSDLYIEISKIVLVTARRGRGMEEITFHFNHIKCNKISFIYRLFIPNKILDVLLKLNINIKRR